MSEYSKYSSFLFYLTYHEVINFKEQVIVVIKITQKRSESVEKAKELQQKFLSALLRPISLKMILYPVRKL